MLRPFSGCFVVALVLVLLGGSSPDQSHGEPAIRALSAKHSIAQRPMPSPSPSPKASNAARQQFQEPSKPGVLNFVGRVRHAITQWFSHLVTSALRPVFDLLGRTVFSTPELANNQRLVQLWSVSLAIADAALLVLLLVGSGLVTVGGGLAAQLTAKELLPRLLIAAFAANVSLILLRQLIDLSNSLTRAMLGSVAPAEVAREMIGLIGSASLGNPFLALLGLAVIILGILVVVGYVIRVAALVVLAVAAPLLLVGAALPHTDGYARMWWRAILAFLAAPVAQSLLLIGALKVLLTGDGVLRLPLGGGFIDILVVGTLLYFLYKVPFWMLNTAFSGAGSRAVLQVKRIGREVAKAVTPA